MACGCENNFNGNKRKLDLAKYRNRFNSFMGRQNTQKKQTRNYGINDEFSWQYNNFHGNMQGGKNLKDLKVEF